MTGLNQLLENNRAWAERINAQEPGFFLQLSRQQSPRYLWIGCSDSRVPANELVGLRPGELFVHRNIANVVVHTDLNCLSVVQFAVEVLRVEHIIVCGHYGCGGVEAAWKGTPLGLADNWIRHVQDVAEQHAGLFPASLPEGRKVDLLCELNVIEQVVHVCRTSVVQEAWRHGQPLAVHGWIYRLQNGLLRDLAVTVAGANGLDGGYRRALAEVCAALQPTE